MNILIRTKIALYNVYLLYRFAFLPPKKYFIENEKSYLRKIWDLTAWLISRREFNTEYYAYGLNIAGSRQTNYIGTKEFVRLKEMTEKRIRRIRNCGDLDYDILCKDKFYSNSILIGNGIPAASHFGFISNGKLIGFGGFERELDSLLKSDELFFLKRVTLEAGKGIYFCKPEGQVIWINNSSYTMEQFREFLHNFSWILQYNIQSNTKLKRVNKSALNTTRIVTILNNKEPEYFSGFQVFATDNALTDSENGKSIYIGLNIKNQCLKQYGYYNAAIKNLAIAENHPESGIAFKSLHIPYLDDAVQLCCRAHKLFYNNFILGWDIAITDEGPIILEVNESPGIKMVQCVDGGLKSRIYQYAKKQLI